MAQTSPPFSLPQPPPAPANGVLGQVLAQAAQRQQQASLAGSALARKSHPQTLNRPPKDSKAQPPAPTMQPQAQPVVPGTPPQPQAVSAPGAPMPSSAYGPLIASLQKRQADETAAEQNAAQALQGAINQPTPTAPTYTAPTMAQQNPGMVLGAALASLLVPKYSQGAIAGLGVDQQNREKAYEQSTQQAQDKYKASMDAFNAQTSARNDAITNAEKMDALHDRNINTLDTRISSLTNEAAIRLDAEQKEKDLEQHRDFLEKQALRTYEQKNAFHQDQMETIKQRLGVENRSIDARLLISSNSLSQQLGMFNIRQKDTENLNNMRMVAQFVLQKDRDWQRNHSDQVNAATNMMRTSNAMISSITNLAKTNPQAAAAMAKNYVNSMNSDQGQAMRASMKSLGIDPDGAGQALSGLADSLETSDASAGTAGATTSQGDVQLNPLPNNITLNINGANAQGGAEPGLNPTGPYGSVDDMVKDAHRIVSRLNGGGNGGSGSGGGDDHQHQRPQQPQIDKQELQTAQTQYDKWVKHFNGDKNKAWSTIASYIPAKDRESIRRIVMGVGGNSNPGKVIAPVRGVPPLNQALGQAGISPALLPQLVQ